MKTLRIITFLTFAALLCSAAAFAQSARFVPGAGSTITTQRGGFAATVTAYPPNAQTTITWITTSQGAPAGCYETDYTNFPLWDPSGLNFLYGGVVSIQCTESATPGLYPLTVRTFYGSATVTL